MSAPTAVLSLGSRILMGTSLKAVGSFARLGDYHEAGDPALMKAAVRREVSMLGTVAAATYGLEHLYANMQGLYRVFPKLANHRNMMQFVPLAVAYALAEGVSKKVSGLGAQLKHSTAESGPTVITDPKSKTINLFLKGLNGEDQPTKSPVKVAELQFAAQPQANAMLGNAAQAYYSYPNSTLASNPFATYNPYLAR
jgi:hypothetical protein